MTGFEPLLAKPDWNRVTNDDWAKVLSEMSLFAGVGTRQLRKLTRQAHVAEFARGETIVMKGDDASAFFVILGGTAEVRSGPGPTSRTLTTGDYFGELALLDGEPRSATVVAAEDLHVLRLPRKPFMELLDHNPGVAHAMLTELSGRLRRAEHERLAR